MILSVGAVSAVEQLTLEFEPPEGGRYLDPLGDRGFRFRREGDGWTSLSRDNSHGNLPQNGSYFVQVSTNAPPIVFYHTDGDPFAVHSIDIAEYSSSVNTEGLIAEFVATFSDGSTDTVTIPIDGVIDGVGPLEDFEHFTFPPGWSDVVELALNSGSLAFDNLELTGRVVPDVEPLGGYTPLADAREVAVLPPLSQVQSWVITGVSEHGIHLALAQYSQVRPSGQQLLVGFDGEVKRGSRSDDLVAGLTFRTDEDLHDLNFAVLIEDDGTRHELPNSNGTHTVDSFSRVRADGLQIAVVNHWLGELEDYAVFLNTPEGLETIVAPGTVLPDGGEPASFPGDLYFADGAVAFESSSSADRNTDRWFFYFPDGGIRFGLGDGETLPGMASEVTQLRAVHQLNHDFARYEVYAGRPYLIETRSDGSHQVLASPDVVADPLLVGYGTGFGPWSLFYDVAAERAYFFHSAGCATILDAEWRLVADQRPVSGVDVSPVAIGGAYDGKVYGLGTNDADQQVLVEATPTFERPEPRIRSVSTTHDGTLRLDAANLTLGRSYAVERFDFTLGEWLPSGEFVAESATRSVLGTHHPSDNELFRLRYEQ